MTAALTDLSAEDLTLLKSALLSYKNYIHCEQDSPRTHSGVVRPPVGGIASDAEQPEAEEQEEEPQDDEEEEPSNEGQDTTAGGPLT